MAEQKTNAMRMLDKAKIPYQIHTYEHSDGKIDGVSVAAKLGQDVDTVYKTLVTRGASRANYVFVIPVAKELDLKKAAKSVGEKSVEMIHVDEINKTTGYIRGGCSPVGMKKLFVTVFDEAVNSLPRVVVSGGRIGCQIEAAPSDLLPLVKAKTADITF
ncbi:MULTISPECIES: Cys-tRNA(Pro) deacylase [Anaerotruncus]|jgi:Cys-tRNA(Pro)/Cys-tRNA(Cys) deacylase|uniref:Cys-tRNA(Pro) deacylase n=1 Tax=Anaerotruncus TaxID=244127 RepID=UPI000E528AE5|nr:MULTISPECIES: Cys-tRNA(Pro) deacylase [Anaerotruncus]RGX55414.1 Cys-tRNA(Pro) deacylase [Anaerotruncus sp. AF02-27]